jgi:hypothetical protein
MKMEFDMSQCNISMKLAVRIFFMQRHVNCHRIVSLQNEDAITEKKLGGVKSKKGKCCKAKPVTALELLVQVPCEADKAV